MKIFFRLKGCHKNNKNNVIYVIFIIDNGSKYDIIQL